MSRILKSRFINVLSLILAVIMVWPAIVMGATPAEKAPLKPVVISDIPGDCKISVGKGEDVKAGSKGIITRSGKDIAKFEITSVEWGYSTIKVYDNVPGETVRVGDSIQITDTSTAKIKKKSNAGAIIGGVLLLAAILSIKSKHGGSSNNGGGTGTVGGPPNSIRVVSSIPALEADGNSFAQISATVVDAEGRNVTDGTIVDFQAIPDSAGGGNCTITQSSATSSGVAVAYMFSKDINGNISKPGTTTIAVTVGMNQPNGVPKPIIPLENKIVKVQVVSNWVALIALSGPPISVTDWSKAGSKFNITAVVRDADHNAVVDGTAVYFSCDPGMINGDSGAINDVAASVTKLGIATATLVSDYQQVPGKDFPKNVVITARCNGQQSSLKIDIVNQSGGGGGTIARSLQLTSNPNRIQTSGLVGGVTTSIITATCLANGAPATSGSVTFTSSIGSVVGSAQIVNGIATTSFSSNIIGTADITAKWEDAQATTQVIVTSGPPNLIEVTSAPSSIECDGNAFTTITATVKDVAGNNVTDGTVVKFGVQPDSTGGGNGTITPVASTSNGQATALLISRDSANAISKPGTATVNAAVRAADQPSGIPVPIADIENHKTQVQFISQDVAEIHVGATKTNIRGWDFVNNTTTIAAVVYDKQHNPVPDGTAVYFTANHGMIYGDSGTAGNVTVSVTKNGQASATLVSDASGDGSWNGLVDITATSGAVTVTAPGMVIFSGWPSFLTSSAVMFPTTIASVKDSAVITIIARDINGNPIVDGTPVSIETTKGTLTSGSTVTAGGVVEVTLKTSEDTANPTQPGPGRIKIRIDSGGHNPETGNGPLPLSIDFTITQ